MAKRKNIIEASLSAAQIAVRGGYGEALQSWIAEAKAAGDGETARILGQLAGLRDYIAESLDDERKTWPEVAVYLHHQEGKSYWFLGDWDMAESTEEYPNEWPRLMGQLLLGWQRYYPALEWLARELRLPRLAWRSSVPTGGRAAKGEAAIDAGEHLTPTKPGHEVYTLTMSPFVAPRIADPTQCESCIGRGNVTCERCKGDGSVADEDCCETCDGLGWHTCRTCQGTGKRQS